MKNEILGIHTSWKDCDHTTIMAVENGLPIGTVMIEYGGWEKRQAMIWNLCVDKGSRKKKIGTTLLRAAIEDATKQGASDVHLEWHAEDTEGWVLDWYKRQGFFVDSIIGVKEKRHVVQMTLAGFAKKKGGSQ